MSAIETYDNEVEVSLDDLTIMFEEGVARMLTFDWSGVAPEDLQAFVSAIVVSDAIAQLTGGLTDDILARSQEITSRVVSNLKFPKETIDAS